MDFIDNATSESFDNISIIDDNNIYIYIEYIVIILAIIFFSYIIYRLFFNKQQENISIVNDFPDLNNKTILYALKWCADNYPDYPALMVRKDNNWSFITYKDYYKNCINFAREINYWVGTKANIAILGFNSPAWFYAHLGCLFNCGISIGIYPTSQSDICEYILNNADVDVLVVEDSNQLKKILGKDIPKLKLILYYSPISDEFVKKFKIPVVSFGAFMNSKEKYKIKLSDKPNLEDIATIIYTSGTTGDAKGVMITHQNIISTINSILSTIKQSNLNLVNGERFVSYLPLNHILAQAMDIYTPICTLGTVWFADKDALKSTLVNTLKDARPTIFVGVPRVWEKIQEKIESNYITNYLPTLLIRNKIINEIGLNKCKYCITTSAPSSKNTIDYFESLGLILYDIYGLSETCGPVSINAPGFNVKGSVGIPINNTHIKIDQGEILVKSKSIFKGYYKDQKSTKKSMKDGWFRTGDLGYIFNNYLYITGRKKEIIITKGGENISPIPIENNVMKHIKGLEYAVIIGDNKKFLSVLLIPKLKNNKLTNHIKQIDPTINSTKDLNTSQKITDYINNCINNINQEAKSQACKIQKWIFIENEFKVGQELSATLKLRRHYINEKYKDIINKLYN